MDIRNNIQPQVFTAKFLSSRATAEVNKFAKAQGVPNFMSEINNSIKTAGNQEFNIKHLYSRMLNVSKTEIKYEKDGQKYSVIETSSKIKNPIEFTMQLLNSLKDSNSALYQKLFG